MRGQLLVVDHRAHQTDAERFVGTDAITQEQQLSRLRRPDGLREHPRAAVVAGAPDAEERADEQRRARRVAQVARAREREAGTGARTVDGRDGDRGHGVQELGDLHDRAQVERPAPRAPTIPSGHRGDVTAGAEAASRAGEHDHPRGGIAREIAQRVAQSDHVFEVERVEAFGSVQRDAGDPTVTLDADGQDCAAFAACTRAKICSGPSGVFVAFTPSGRSASATALATAAWAPMAPPSPMPL